MPWIKSLTGLFSSIILIALSLSPALAHSFDVTLLIPLSGPQKEQGTQFLDGFMLATRERDGHPAEESDGHLGGLDVYVTAIDSAADIEQQISMLQTSLSNGQSNANIVAYLATPTNAQIINNSLNQSNLALLVTGQNPFASTQMAGVEAFISNFSSDYSYGPTDAAASGYNAARRIDIAVRAQGGASNILQLKESFDRTNTDFIW